MVYRNGDRGQGLFGLIEFALFIIKAAISLLGAVFVWIWISFIPKTPFWYSTSDVNMPLIPTIFCFCVSIFLTSTYCGAYDTVLKTVVQCTYVDEEMFVGDQRFQEEVVDEFITYWRPPNYGDKERPEAEFAKLRAGEELLDQDMFVEVAEEQEEFGHIEEEEEPSSDDDDRYMVHKEKFREDDDEFMLPEFMYNAEKEKAKEINLENLKIESNDNEIRNWDLAETIVPVPVIIEPEPVSTKKPLKWELNIYDRVVKHIEEFGGDLSKNKLDEIKRLKEIVAQKKIKPLVENWD